jgi:hypothetical protein
MSAHNLNHPIHIGGFRELSLIETDPPVSGIIGRGTYANPERVARYLRQHQLLAVAPDLPTDRVTGELGKEGNAELRTDGKYTWDSRLAYYVETYGIALPEEFARHVQLRTERDLRGL